MLFYSHVKQFVIASCLKKSYINNFYFYFKNFSINIMKLQLGQDDRAQTEGMRWNYCVTPLKTTKA